MRLQRRARRCPPSLRASRKLASEAIQGPRVPTPGLCRRYVPRNEEVRLSRYWGTVTREAVPNPALHAWAKADSLSGESPSAGRLHRERLRIAPHLADAATREEHHGQAR